MGLKTVPIEESVRPIDPSLRIGSVALAVADLPRSVDFYGRVLGLPTISFDPDLARLGPDPERPALELRRLERPRQASPHSTGLFHVAWLHRTREALADTLARVLGARWPLHGAADHGVSEAVYLTDPDGLGVEIYADRPRERWPRPPGGRGVEMVTLPLDLDNLLARAPLEPAPAMDPATTVGHVHLKVSDVDRAAAFYRDALGFEEQAQLPSAEFLSAGGYHHHIALNSWQSRSARPPSDSAPGLRLVAFRLGEEEALAALERRLSGDGHGPQFEIDRRPGSVYVSDPDGHRLRFSDAG